MLTGVSVLLHIPEKALFIVGGVACVDCACRVTGCLSGTEVCVWICKAWGQSTLAEVGEGARVIAD